jgi:hypothetical protein
MLLRIDIFLLNVSQTDAHLGLYKSYGTVPGREHPSIAGDVPYRFFFRIGSSFSIVPPEPEPVEADEGTATSIRTVGTTYTALLTSSRK